MLCKTAIYKLGKPPPYLNESHTYCGFEHAIVIKAPGKVFYRYFFSSIHLDLCINNPYNIIVGIHSIC